MIQTHPLERTSGLMMTALISGENGAPSMKMTATVSVTRKKMPNELSSLRHCASEGPRGAPLIR